MDKAALEYVLETARKDDINITQEQGRKSLGALGLTGEMALARIGKEVPLMMFLHKAKENFLYPTQISSFQTNSAGHKTQKLDSKISQQQEF